MAQQGKKKRSWWIDVPLAAGIVAAVGVYNRHYPPLQQGRMLVVVAIATLAMMIGFKLIDSAVGRSRRKPQQRRRGYGYRGTSGQ